MENKNEGDNNVPTTENVHPAIALALLMLIPFVSWGATEAANTVTTLKAEKLSCGSCATRIKRALESQPGIAGVDVDIEAGKVIVSHDAKAIEPARIAAVVTETGYPSAVVKTAANDGPTPEAGKTGRKSTGVGCSCCNKN